MVERYDISGTSIDEIEITDELELCSLFQSDLFLVSQQVLSNVSPDRTYDSCGHHYTNEYRSCKITYDQLSDQLFNDLCGTFGIKNMAWESSAHYSLAGHIHNYTNADLSAYMTPKTIGVVDADTGIASLLSNIATFVVDTKYSTIAMPHISLYEQPKACIGQLKFLAVGSFKKVDEQSELFDGWTYPDGKKLMSADFPEAWNVFGTTYGGSGVDGEFAIPNICNFLYMSEYDYQHADRPLSTTIPYHNALSSHSHTIHDMRVEGSVSVDISVSLTLATPPPSDGIHEGEGDITKLDGYFEFGTKHLSCSESQISQTDAQFDVETHPTFNYVPVMMYIGKRAPKKRRK